MIGRRRGLRPAINASDKWLRARAERAAINTPIQGSAADVASAAMLSIVMDRELREMGWKLLLQVGQGWWVCGCVGPVSRVCL
jgi:DNA polymerase-1